jgi:type IV pilus assembly protein PilQ
MVLLLSLKPKPQQSKGFEQQRVDYQDATPIFRGLQVVGEERTNSLTLVGSPQLIELATQQLVRLDLRRRQVAINVRVIDVDLNAVNAFGTSFSFSIGNSNFVSNGGWYRQLWQ